MKVGLIGGAGYVGGELLRILLSHPEVELTIIVSRSNAGKFIFKIHPNLRGLTDLKFTPLDVSSIARECDLVFTATPHGSSMEVVPQLLDENLKVIDMSADYRLKNPNQYPQWYQFRHTTPDLLEKAVYGLPELHREEIKKSQLIACPGCMSTATILGLAPLIKNRKIDAEKIIVDVKIGSSGAGAQHTPASHHPERSGGVRPYKVVGHRHIPEIEQELNLLSKSNVNISFTPHAVDLVRGIFTTIHTFPLGDLVISDLWKIYRAFYAEEPFVRLVKDREGVYQLPNPKTLIGSNICDIGFEIDEHAHRLIVFSALDNLVKGAAGQGIQCLNILYGLDETIGLAKAGIHPV